MVEALKGVFRGFDIATAGLRAELARSEIVASNLVNMHRTGTATREPYRRKIAVFEELFVESLGKAGRGLGNGTAVVKVVEDQSPFPMYFQPGHPDADGNGMVLGSNVEIFQELADMKVIERRANANLAAMRTYRQMLQNVLQNMNR